MRTFQSEREIWVLLPHLTKIVKYVLTRTKSIIERIIDPPEGLVLDEIDRSVKLRTLLFIC